MKYNYHFGIVPWYATDSKSGFKNVNARNDNLLKSGQWKPLVDNNKRCLVLADGFYEWEKSCGQKLPWRFTLSDRDLFAFADLYSRWRDPNTKEDYWSFSIITTEPNFLLKRFHDRMPVILTKEEEKLWLSDDVPIKDIIDLTNQQCPADMMNAYRVSKAVNITKGDNNKGMELILPENGQ